MTHCLLLNLRFSSSGCLKSNRKHYSQQSGALLAVITHIDSYNYLIVRHY